MGEKQSAHSPAVQDIGEENSLNEEDKAVMAQMGKEQRLPFCSHGGRDFTVKKLTIDSVDSTS